MSRDPDRLWQLLPLYHRQEDEAQGGPLGGPLRALLRLLATEADRVEAGIERLYANAFIETCEDWAVPYLGALIGWQPVHEAALPPQVLAPRREVANTIGWRRRKGTLALLPELARDVAGWPALAVEAAAQAAATAAPNLPGLRYPALLDLRAGQLLARIGTAFEALPRSVELRRAGAARRPGRHAPNAVLLHAQRARAFPVTRGDATCIEERGRHCFSFSALGQNLQLYTAEALPVPIRRRALQERAPGDPADKPGLAHHWYGPGRSLAVWAPGWPDAKGDLIPPERFVVADLDNWRYRPRPGTVAIDPLRGRLAFPPQQPPRRVAVSYHYGFSGELGGGEYFRPAPDADGVMLLRVGEGYDRLAAALAAWREGQARRAVIEFTTSQTFDEARLAIEIPPGHSLTLRAAAHTRPVLRLLDRQAGREDSLRVAGGPGSELRLEGLTISGRALRIGGPLARLALHHCTLVPGWELHQDGTPQHPGGASLLLEAGETQVEIGHSILGGIQVSRGDTPLAITLADSILDAAGAPDPVIGAPGELVAPVLLTLRRTTVLGALAVHGIALAEDSILDGAVLVARRQLGCLRHCWVAPGSRTPPRHDCQPDRAMLGLAGPTRREAARALAPVFASRRYGTPGYARLLGPERLRHAATDEGEPGAFHDLFWPQREAALRQRLAEFVPASADAGLVFLE